MTAPTEVRGVLDAVRRFAAEVGRGGVAEAERVQARLDGDGGMTRLCVVEAALSDCWPLSTARELVWLTRAAPSGCDVLQLLAFERDGSVLGEATFSLADGVDV